MDSDTSVRSWPVYLLWNIPPDLRSAISTEARQLDISIRETIRRILCARYDLDCEPVTLRRGGMVGYDKSRDTGHPSIYLPLQPSLREALDEDTSPRRKKRDAIMEALTDHYKAA